MNLLLLHIKNHHTFRLLVHDETYGKEIERKIWNTKVLYAIIVQLKRSPFVITNTNQFLSKKKEKKPKFQSKQTQ